MQFCGSRIKEAREALGLTQPQLAAQIEVSEDTIRRAELGKFDPRAGTIGRLASALNLSVDDLFESEPAA